MSFLKIIRWTAWTLVAVGLFGVAGVILGWLQVEKFGAGRNRPVTVVSSGVPAIGGPFSLVNHRGERVTQDTFKGKATAYFFGFTHCPDVCPTTLFEMTEYLEQLGPDADRLNVVFITVDPERDTPELLRTYLESFDPRIVGLTGTPEEVAAMAKEFRISYCKVPMENGEYTMDHAASVIVTDTQGAYVTLIDSHEDATMALTKLKRALAD